MPVIIGRDPVTGDLGIALSRKFLAIGAIAPAARAGVGAIATLGHRINTSYRARGLDLLASGRSPREVIRLLTRDDPLASVRQVGIVAANGAAMVYTGTDLESSKDGWAGGGFGPDLVVFGHRLRDERTVTAMAETFQVTRGRLWVRLLAALDAGMDLGGDIREGHQHSAALLVVGKSTGRGRFDDRLIDLRVDDERRAVDQLHRLLKIHERLFLPPNPADLVPITTELARALQSTLAFHGDYDGSITGVYDAVTRAALEKFAARVNLEEHVRLDDRIDPRLLERLEIRPR